MSEAQQRFYTVPELAKEYNLSDDTIRRDFRNAPEVLHVAKSRSRKDPLRIPQSAVDRWLSDKQRRHVAKGKVRKAKPLPPGQGRVLNDGAITPKSVDELWKSL